MNPWEKFAPQTTPKPWEKFGGAPQASDENSALMPGGINNTPKIIQEQHPDVSLAQRAMLKTFANSPDSMAKYLTQSNPNMEARTNPSGQVIVRNKGEKDFRVLDPQTGIDVTSMQGIKELGKDVLEGAYDTGTGLVENAAGVMAGTAAAPLTGGLGAIPAGMAASGVVSAGNEALRQKIGQALGIPQEVNAQDVALSGGVGALSPLLLGQGKALKGAKGVAGDIFESGVLGTGAKNTTAKAAEAFTGIKSDLFKRATANPNLMKQIDDQGEDVVANEAVSNLFQNMDDRYQGLKEQINTKLRNSGAEVDISSVKKYFDDMANKFKGNGSMSNSDKAKLSQLEELKKNTLQRTKEVTYTNNTGAVKTTPLISNLPDKVDASEAFKVKEALKDSADFLNDKFKSNKSEGDKAISTIAEQAYGHTKGALEAAIPEAGGLNKQYRETLSDMDYLRNKFKNPKAKMGDELAFDEKGAKQITKIGYGGDKAFERKVADLDKRYGTSIVEDAKNIAAADLASNAGWATRSLKGITSTSRSLQGQAAGGVLGGLVGSMVDNKDGRVPGYLGGAAIGAVGTSPRAFLNYMKATQKASRAAAPLQQSAWNLMLNQQE